MVAKKEAEERIEIQRIEIEMVDLRIVGDSPLLVHAWDPKAKQMMLDNQMGKTKTKARPKKNPFSDFLGSLYWITERPKEDTPEAFAEAVRNGARFGFQATAIKKAANSAAYRMGWVSNQKVLQGMYYIFGKDDPNLVEVKGCVPEMREDMVAIKGTTDIRYRGEFKNWYIDFTIRYNKNGPISLEQIINCINAGGFAVGIGEWRPEKNGMLGMYHVEMS